MKNRSINSPFYYLVGLSVILLAILLSLLEPIQQSNNNLTDRFHGSIGARPEIIVVGIDDNSLQQIGAWPWSRDVFAKALDNMKNESPRVAALDVLLVEDREGDEGLEETLLELDFEVVLPAKLIDQDTVINSKFLSENVSYGFINLDTDIDGKIRRTQIASKLGEECIYSFAGSVVNAYLNPSKFYDCHNTLEKENSIREFQYTQSKYDFVSFVDLYNGDFEPGLFRDKIVLVGATISDLKYDLNDNFIDIFGNTTPGVLIHANIANTFLEDKFLSEPAKVIDLLSGLLIGIALIAAFSKNRSNYRSILLLLLSLAFINLLGVYIFDYGYLFNFVTYNAVTISAFVYFIFYRDIRNYLEGQFVKQAFGQYVNPVLLKELIKDAELLKLGGQKKDMTVFFSDIRSFTTISESMSAEVLVEFLNKYLDQVSETIINYNGTIDKYIGDAVMAFWNAPIEDKNHSLNAVLCSLELLDGLKIFNKKYDNYPKLEIGIGLNSGEMVVGNIGSMQRFDYTVLGDNVNLGSRLEGLTKKYGVELLVAESVKSRIGDNDNVVFRQLDEVIVKGKNEPVKIYEAMKKNPTSTKFSDDFDKGFALYQKGEFAEATIIFTKFSDDKASKVLIERMKSIDKKKWKGVWKWEEK